MREYIVVVKEGVDLTSVDAELASDSGTIPRAVECIDACEHDTRMTHWNLEDDEAETLRNDDRILGVEIPPDQDDSSVIVADIVQTLDFTKTTTCSNGSNWGLFRCNEKTDATFGTSNTTITNQDYHYALDGTGVDIVVMDSGIQADHPEFNDKNGVSRVKQIDWYAESGGNMSGTMPASFYTDTTNHGTFIAGIAASQQFGWAKEAHIYIMTMSDFNSGGGISSFDCFDLIRHWHNNKGTGRPTIVNMSFSYRWDFTNTTTGDSGMHWNVTNNAWDSWTYGNAPHTTPDSVRQNFDLFNFAKPGRRFSSTDAKIDQMIAAGIHVCIAGNNAYCLQFKDTATADHNFNDYFVRPSLNSGNPCHYHRGSSPRTSNNGAEIVVGSIATDHVSDKEQIAYSSSCGEGMDIFAPGENITSTCTTTGASAYNPQALPSNNSFRYGNGSGTSFACPQVVGVAALYLQAFPNLTPLELKNKIIHDAQSGVLHDNIGYEQATNQYGNMTPSKGLYGGPNKFLYNKYHGDIVVKHGD